jgi:hypothetical protein
MMSERLFSNACKNGETYRIPALPKASDSSSPDTRQLGSSQWIVDRFADKPPPPATTT